MFSCVKSQGSEIGNTQGDSLYGQLNTTQKVCGKWEPGSPGLPTALNKKQLFQSFTVAFPNQTTLPCDVPCHLDCPGHPFSRKRDH